ncbi:MAG: hypothetical protein H8D23_18925 [Candidatus Brocadiales bacterium]|nr:hypothetical protein [Candidatus Brocadiales bacterium]
MPGKNKRDPEQRNDRPVKTKLGKLKERAKESVRRRIEDWTDEWGEQE